MAVFTELSIKDACRLTEAHGLGPTRVVTPIPAGSVNSNFFLDTDAGRRFARIYEEQAEDGVAFEWALLDHVTTAGIPVPARVPGPGPGELRVAGKPTALFELVGGAETCQRGVTPARTRAVGAAMAGYHAACADFGWRRGGRFRRADLFRRLDEAASHGRPELEAPIARLRAVLEEAERSEPRDLPRGLVHGDLFRDNVRFDGDRIVALIDWESASDGVLLYDLAVTLLAFCYGDTLEWELGAALVGGYESIRPLEEAEWSALRAVTLGAAARFATTRITDFHLRPGGVGDRVLKDYRRFLARLEAIAALSPEGLADRLGRR